MGKCKICGTAFIGGGNGSGLCPSCGGYSYQKTVDISFLFILPIKLIKWLVIKPCWWLTKKLVPAICRICWKIAKNKWTWTIFTCGMSWVAWKMLDAIYAPKVKEE